MASNTGESEQGLRKITDMTRMISLILLALHFYYFGYTQFERWGLVSPFSDRVLSNISNSGIFSGLNKSKLLSLLFLVLSLLGIKGRKEETLVASQGWKQLVLGIIIYGASNLILYYEWTINFLFPLYILLTVSGYILVLGGGTTLSKVIKQKLNLGDIFNKMNESFPQHEGLIQNENSINLPAKYYLRGKIRHSWINFINPFRGIMVAGSPGSGKTYFVFRHIIAQHIEKGFSMFVYDFKYPDLSVIAYNNWLKNRDKYAIAPKFYSINFDDLSKTNRCNPLEPNGMLDITDATESARTILVSLNRQWIKRQGDFFVESSINFLTAVIWFLRKYQDGEYCTLPHVIEFMQTDYENLFTVLRTEKEIEALINPFISAYQNDAMQQLEGQIASAKISLARLASPQLYYVLSGNDFTLDINNPSEPKIVCMGNNPQKIQIYGAVLSLFITRLIKMVNKKGKLKSSLIFDEFPTIYLDNMDNLIATARSNKVATTIGIQDLSQLKKDYGREQADVIMNITGNIISGQVTGETARQLSDRFGKIMQDRSSLSINRMDTSMNRSKQLDLAIPPSTISKLSSGEFVGVVADDPNQKIQLKAFHAEIINDHNSIKLEEEKFKNIPKIKEIDQTIIMANYNEIKEEIASIIQTEMERILADPALSYLVVRKEE